MERAILLDALLMLLASFDDVVNEVEPPAKKARTEPQDPVPFPWHQLLPELQVTVRSLCCRSAQIALRITCKRESKHGSRTVTRIAYHLTSPRDAKKIVTKLIASDVTRDIIRAFNLQNAVVHGACTWSDSGDSDDDESEDLVVAAKKRTNAITAIKILTVGIRFALNTSPPMRKKAKTKNFLVFAASDGCVHLFREWFLKYGGASMRENGAPEFDVVIEKAIKYGHTNMVIFLLEQSRVIWLDDTRWNTSLIPSLLRGAIAAGNTQLITLLYQRMNNVPGEFEVGMISDWVCQNLCILNSDEHADSKTPRQNYRNIRAFRALTRAHSPEQIEAIQRLIIPHRFRFSVASNNRAVGLFIRGLARARRLHILVDQVIAACTHRAGKLKKRMKNHQDEMDMDDAQQPPTIPASFEKWEFAKSPLYAYNTSGLVTLAAGSGSIRLLDFMAAYDVHPERIDHIRYFRKEEEAGIDQKKQINVARSAILNRNVATLQWIARQWPGFLRDNSTAIMATLVVTGWTSGVDVLRAYGVHVEGLLEVLLYTKVASCQLYEVRPALTAAGGKTLYEFFYKIATLLPRDGMSVSHYAAGECLDFAILAAKRNHFDVLEWMTAQGIPLPAECCAACIPETRHRLHSTKNCLCMHSTAILDRVAAALPRSLTMPMARGEDAASRETPQT